MSAMEPDAAERAADVVREMYYDPDVWATHGAPNEKKAAKIEGYIKFAIECAYRDGLRAAKIAKEE